MSSIRLTWTSLVTALLVGLPVLACEPVLMFPGGRLSGEEGTWPTDWRSVADVEEVQLETRPDDPYSLNVWVVVVNGEPYLATSLLTGPEVPTEREWVRIVAADPHVRVRVQGVLYRARLDVLDDERLKSKVRMAYKQKYPNSDSARADAARFYRIGKRVTKQ